jgi:hypothetical protein
LIVGQFRLIGTSGPIIIRLGISRVSVVKPRSAVQVYYRSRDALEMSKASIEFFVPPDAPIRSVEMVGQGVVETDHGVRLAGARVLWVDWEAVRRDICEECVSPSRRDKALLTCCAYISETQVEALADR